MTLKEFFEANPKVAIACSGGADSTFLVHEAVRYGADVLPIIVRSNFSIPGEVDAAVDFCRSEGLDLVIADIDMLLVDGMVENPEDRCYRCKKTMFEAIHKSAHSRRYFVVLDGTNASDPEDERPGMRALRELGVLSPLRDAGLTKDRIRELSREQGLSTWDKESDSCLATRVPHGVILNGNLLGTIADAEKVLREKGFSEFRIRTNGMSAQLLVPAGHLGEVLARADEVESLLSFWFFEVSIGTR